MNSGKLIDNRFLYGDSFVYGDLIIDKKILVAPAKDCRIVRPHYTTFTFDFQYILTEKFFEKAEGNFEIFVYHNSK